MPSESPTSSDVDAGAIGRARRSSRRRRSASRSSCPSRAIAASAGTVSARGRALADAGEVYGVPALIGRQAACAEVEELALAAHRGDAREQQRRSARGSSTKLSRSLLTISSGAASYW